jgi:hypothetical protein
MDAEIADEIIRRAGTAALLYYPELPADDPGWSLNRDVDWVLEPRTSTGADVSALRELIAQVILDPTGIRHALVTALHTFPTAR